MSENLLAAALSAITDTTIITNAAYKQRKRAERGLVCGSELSLEALHNTHLIQGDVPQFGLEQEGSMKDFIYARTLTGKKLQLKYSGNYTIQRVKEIQMNCSRSTETYVFRPTVGRWANAHRL